MKTQGASSEATKVQCYCVYENPATQERLEVEFPLKSLVNPEELKKEIGIPEFVDSSSFQMRKAIVTLWASRNPSKFFEGATEYPLKVALFGGGGFKVHCPSANKGPFCRKVGDIDLITTSKNSHGKKLVGMLCNLAEKCGSMYFHGVSSLDAKFNALRAGRRYRLHTIKDVDKDGAPICGLMDIFCDRLTFCHKVDVQNELNDLEKHFFTIGLENLIISKAQLIKNVAKDRVGEAEKNRIVGEYDAKSFLIGMEEKDMQDVGAALVDHELGKGVDKIDVDIVGLKLKQDWGLFRTVTLNLKNMLHRSALITDIFGADNNQMKSIEEKLAKILEQLESKYAPRKKLFSLGKQWWEDVEDQFMV